MKRLKNVLLLMIVMCTGCLMPDFLQKRVKVDNYYTVPAFQDFSVRDVVFTGFTSQVPLTPEQKTDINTIFLTELRRRNWYRIHPMSPEEAGDFNTLKRMDAVIEGEVLNYKAMDPLKFGIRISLKYLNTGQTLWSVSNIFDATDKDVVRAVRAYYQEKKDSTASLWEHERYLISINKYIEFCCNMLIDTIEQGWQEQVRISREEARREKELSRKEEPGTGGER